MKIYLAGPMRGYANFNFPAFDYAAAKLRGEGHEVFSPADQDRKVYGKFDENPTGAESVIVQEHGFSMREALRIDTHWICRHADAIALLPGWEKSNGANAEFALAKALGLTIIILGERFVKK